MGDAGETENIYPLIQFFELTHMSDLVQQLLDVYYIEQIVSVCYLHISARSNISALFRNHTLTKATSCPRL
jgi:hypothetical protein